MDEPRDDAAAVFEAHRTHLRGLAYRMLGSLADAEDVVQEAWLRWHAADRDAVQEPRAYLTRVVTRLCLDQLKSARVRRERYVGPWLPEPVLDEAALAAETHSVYAHDVSVALLLALQRLSPLERAAFLLHDVFDVDFGEVAAMLGRGEAACRQLAARARAHVRAERPRFEVSPEEGQRLVEAFLAAAGTGDAGSFARLLAQDVVMHTDGGGKKSAALKLVRGQARIANFLAVQARRRHARGEAEVRRVHINGLPGLVISEVDGSVQTLALEARDGLIAAIYVVRNPDKLRHIAS